VCVDLAIDILVVQEPWLIPSQGNYLNTRSINHPTFTQIFLTLLDPLLRLRVLLYALNDFQAQINPLVSFLSDLDCQVVMISSTTFTLNLINVYNEDDQQGLLRRTIKRSLFLRQLPTDCLVLGDFNTHNPW